MPADTLALIIALVISIAFWLFMNFWLNWFPATHKFRLHKKMKGTRSYYRSEVKRPIFGWTPFGAFYFTGYIVRESAWVSSKEMVMDNIKLFKELKNIKDEKDEKTIY